MCAYATKQEALREGVKLAMACGMGEDGQARQHGTTSFAYDGGSNNLTSDGTSSFTRTPDGELQAMTDGTTAQWSITDQHTDLTPNWGVSI
ncbi:hypothetical protein ACFYT4_36150 [Streptomyces sp. NPDC004609]|uniref:hypothetical protein n=1 Tax=Streptomyces sp. NPDC004609 TaxID=3364704 RepID=UPI00368C2B54